VQLAIEYDPRPPLGGIDWSTVDRDMLRSRVEGVAKEALGDNPGCSPAFSASSAQMSGRAALEND
jgi:hypothetical protein